MIFSFVSILFVFHCILWQDGVVDEQLEQGLIHCLLQIHLQCEWGSFFLKNLENRNDTVSSVFLVATSEVLFKLPMMAQMSSRCSAVIIRYGGCCRDDGGSGEWEDN